MHRSKELILDMSMLGLSWRDLLKIKNRFCFQFAKVITIKINILWKQIKGFVC